MTHTKPIIITLSLLLAASAHADMLVRKGGEGHSTTTGVSPQPVTMDMCFTETTVEEATAKLAAQPNCTRKTIRMSGNVATLDIACGTMTMQGTVTFSGSTSYHSDLTMHVGAGAEAKVVHALTDAKWIGACKPGETPR